jgi:hypothetical protein
MNIKDQNEGLARIAMNDATLYALAHMLYQRSLEYAADVLEGDVTDLRAANATLQHDILSMLGSFEQVRSLQLQRLTAEVVKLRMRESISMVIPKEGTNGL